MTINANYAVLCLLLAVAPLCIAQPLKVDISEDNGRRDVLTSSCENWLVWNAPMVSQSFGNISVAIAPIKKGSDVAILWYKGGLDTDATFSSDAIAPTDGGGITLTISGLTEGKHTITTWHSNPITKPIDDFSISRNGKVLVERIHPSQRVSSDDDATSATVEVESDGTNAVVLTFVPLADADSPVVLNGFAIDMPDPSTQARHPLPDRDDEHAAENPILQWTAPAGTVTHRLYLGTDPSKIATATPQSPEFVGELKDAKYQTRDLSHMQTYFWRVDEVMADKRVTTGEVWRFRTRHLAFPGAEGYGRFARGGRGGRVIEVTNLNDSGPGSFREAVQAQAPRTVVFRVGGTIHLKSRLGIRNPYITIAGQSAPGEGISLYGYGFGAGGTHDVIMRYMRIRVGDESGLTQDGCGLGGCDHCIVDHCSIAWSIDEGFSSRTSKNITLQRSIIAEPLNMSIHSHYVGTGKGHSFAGSISGDIGSFHHNLLANCAGRNWSLAGGLTKGGRFAGNLDIRNNVVYNWSHRTNDGGVRRCNLVNNYYIPGPASKVFHLLIAKFELRIPGDTQQYFVTGNMMESRPQYDDDNWQNGGVVFDPADVEIMKLNEPFCYPFVTTDDAKKAYDSVMADVGANYPKHDSVDARAISDVTKRSFTFIGSKTKLPGIIDSQRDVGGYPDLKGGEAPPDADHDGMPNAWETAHQLDPANPADGNALGADGYTNLEIYLNSIVEKK